MQLVTAFPTASPTLMYKLNPECLLPEERVPGQPLQDLVDSIWADEEAGAFRVMTLRRDSKWYTFSILDSQGKLRYEKHIPRL